MKTEKALDIALLTLLKMRNFRKITVKDICDAALISRATFYTHFADKYAFLQDWLKQFMPEYNREMPYLYIEDTVNQFINENEIVIKNLINSADDETIGILYDVLLCKLDFNVEMKSNGEINPKYAILRNFCVGGLINYFRWQMNSKFHFKPMNTHLYELLEKFREMIN